MKLFQIAELTSQNLAFWRYRELTATAPDRLAFAIGASTQALDTLRCCLPHLSRVERRRIGSTIRTCLAYYQRTEGAQFPPNSNN